MSYWILFPDEGERWTKPVKIIIQNYMPNSGNRSGYLIKHQYKDKQRVVRYLNSSGIINSMRPSGFESYTISNKMIESDAIKGLRKFTNQLRFVEDKPREITLDKFTELYNSGMSLHKMGVHFGVNNDTLLAFRDEHQLPVRDSSMKSIINKCSYINKLKKLNETGMRIADIAKELGISESTARAYFNTLGLNRKSTKGDKSPRNEIYRLSFFKINKLATLSKSGYSSEEIAEILKCDLAVVNYWQQRYEDEIKPIVKGEDSLYCDTEFLEQIFGKSLETDEECNRRTTES